MRAGSVRTILSLCDEFTPGETPEFFFDRNPDNFPAILNLYRTGRLHATERGCALVLQQDLQVCNRSTFILLVFFCRSLEITPERRAPPDQCFSQYWAVDDMSMEPCCALKYFPQLDVCQSEKDGDLDAKKRALQQAEEEDFGNDNLGQWRTWLWNTIEYPWTSKLAKFLALFSLSMVIISTITFIISTADELQTDQSGEMEWPVVVFIIELTDKYHSITSPSPESPLFTLIFYSVLLSSSSL